MERVQKGEAHWTEIWPAGVVPYDMDIPEKDLDNPEAMAKWRKKLMKKWHMTPPTSPGKEESDIMRRYQRDERISERVREKFEKSKELTEMASKYVRRRERELERQKQRITTPKLE